VSNLGYYDIKKLDKGEKTEILKHVNKIKENPEHFKHLHGGENCYTLRVGNIRIIYLLEGNTIYILSAGRRKDIYDTYHKRLYTLHRELE
jgi:mRNA-degrading endonuclease RelE of RelBE toxin-antitoxin system